MRKDYMPVRQDNSDISEIEMVEQYWTAIWQLDRDNPVELAKLIAHREEYRLMLPYLKQLRPGSRILDSGCGRGEWTIYLGEQGYDMYGVDISRQTITLLKEGFPNYHFECADIRSLDYSSDFFSAYFSWGVFEHFEEGFESCIKEAWRVLQPKGYLFISVPYQNWRLILHDARQLSKRDSNYDPVHGYLTPMRFYQWRLTVSELEQELALGGFKVLQIKPISLQSGLQRTLHHVLGLNYEGRVNYLASRILSLFAPRRWFSHMLLAVATKETTTMSGH